MWFCEYCGGGLFQTVCEPSNYSCTYSCWVWHAGQYLWGCSLQLMVSLREAIAVSKAFTKQAWLLTCLFSLFKVHNQSASVQGGVIRYRSTLWCKAIIETYAIMFLFSVSKLYQIWSLLMWVMILSLSVPLQFTAIFHQLMLQNPVMVCGTSSHSILRYYYIYSPTNPTCWHNNLEITILCILTS